MKWLYSLSLFCGVSSAAALAANECKSKLQTKLSNCATATPFCSSLLGYTAAGNHTLTIYTTAKQTTSTTLTRSHGGTTVFSTVTVYIATTRTTTTTTTSVATATVTFPSATGSPTCFIQTVSEVSRGVPAFGNIAVKTSPASCGFNAAHSAAASTACSCFLDPLVTVTATNERTITVKGTPTVLLTHYNSLTNTVVITTTVAPTTRTITLQACPTPDSSCSNKGLQWAYYTALGGNGYPSNSLLFDPTLYKNQTPIANGTTQLVSIAPTGGSGTGIFYGQGPFPEYSFFVDHRGYFWPPQTGNYTVTFDYTDDAGFLWVGPVAYSGWNNTNWDEYDNWSSAPTSVQISLTKGQYVPVRFAMGQGGGGGGWTVSMYAPDGETVMSSTSSFIGSPYMVSFSCDGTAPAYPPFGAET